MLKKVLTKAVAGTLVAAGLLVVPTAVTGGTELALMAKKTGCQYDVAQTTTTKLEGLPSAVQASATSNFSGSATVEGPAAIPQGTMTVTRAAYASGSYGTPVQVADGTVSGASPTLNFSSSAPAGNTTYRFVATYTTTNCDYSDSTSPAKYVSSYVVTTATTVTRSGNTYTAVVKSQPSDSTAVPVGNLVFNAKATGNSCSGGSSSPSLPGTANADGSRTYTYTVTGAKKNIEAIFSPSNSAQFSASFYPCTDLGG